MDISEIPFRKTILTIITYSRKRITLFEAQPDGLRILELVEWVFIQYEKTGLVTFALQKINFDKFRLACQDIANASYSNPKI